MIEAGLGFESHFELPQLPAVFLYLCVDRVCEALLSRIMRVHGDSGEFCLFLLPVRRGENTVDIFYFSAHPVKRVLIHSCRHAFSLDRATRDVFVSRKLMYQVE